jgi:hypothetical protein
VSVIEQQRLYRLAHEQINIAARWTPAGWTVTVAGRRQGETWAEADRAQVYGALSGGELADTIDGVLAYLLGL